MKRSKTKGMKKSRRFVFIKKKNREVKEVLKGLK